MLSVWTLLFSCSVVICQPSPLDESCFKSADENCSGTLFDIRVSCYNNSYASVTWHDGIYDLNLITIEKVCFDSFNNTAVNLEAIVTNTDAMSSTWKHFYNNDITEGMACVFRGCAVRSLDYDIVSCANVDTGNCSYLATATSSMTLSRTSSSSVAPITPSVAVMSSVAYTDLTVMSSVAYTDITVSPQSSPETQQNNITDSTNIVAVASSRSIASTAIIGISFSLVFMCA